ncbi:hypothetical protein [Microvirga aerophila]|uniref:Uncharacterized protein n=1 Tax=Microvirga aerophila TaxID=670291 RepID=A0A512BKV6_9HYPH|nr:hypothetical protein [Microvirga aerophila]GEO12604.1 hypothetical protein MAE02_03000 [Microvirga aerophila]
MDLEWLKSKLPTERHNLWVNARKRADTGDPKAIAWVEFIEQSGLDYRSNKSLTLDDPISKVMHRIIFSPEGKQVALTAITQGLPPLAKIDPLLQAALGGDYTKHNEGTVQAGYMVTNMMRQMGYKPIGSKKLPPDCVARTGQVFVRDRGNKPLL